MKAADVESGGTQWESKRAALVFWPHGGMEKPSCGPTWLQVCRPPAGAAQDVQSCSAMMHPVVRPKKKNIQKR